MIKEYKHKDKRFYSIQISYTDDSGKRHQRKTRFDERRQRITSKHKAREIEFKIQTELIAEIKSDYKALTFRAFHEKFLKEIRVTHKLSTVKQYDGDLKKWLPSDFLEKSLDSINRNMIYDLIYDSMITRGASENTRYKTLKSVRRIFQSALEEGYIARNPTTGIKVKVPVSKKLVLNTEEASLLLSIAKDMNHKFYYIWAIALFTGMRNGELYALRWRDVDLNSGIIQISASWGNKIGYSTTKSNQSRVLPISKDLHQLLIELKNLGPFKEKLTGLNGFRKTFNDLVLPRSSEWKHGEQSKITKEFCKLIGVTEVKFHDLRATFNTSLLGQGVPVPQVMALVGHSRMSTTDEYLRLAGINIKGATNSLSYKLPIDDKNNIIELSF